LLDDDQIEIGGGLGPWKGKVWRIGLMGESSSDASVRRVLTALGRILPRHGFAVDAAAAVDAADRVLTGSEPRRSA
jgi:alanine-glyoxylate transaminase/serine-glyoxylate transaminase/serine-pyruvate transaminase